MSGEIPFGSESQPLADQFTVLRENEENLAARTTELSEAQTAASQAAAKVRETEQAQIEAAQQLQFSRENVGIAIAQDETVDPVRRAIWSRSFELVNKVSDPVSFGHAQEELADRIAERLQPGALVLQIHKDSISISRVETPGLITDLSVREGAPWRENKDQEYELQAGDISTHPMNWTAVTLGPSLLSSERFTTSEAAITIRSWSDGDKDIAPIRDRFLNNNDNFKIGEDQILEYVLEPLTTGEGDAIDHEIDKRFWTFVLAKKLGVEFPDFRETKAYQTSRAEVQTAIAGTLKKLSLGDRFYRTSDSVFDDEGTLEEIHGMEIWDKEYVAAVMSAFDITPEMVKASAIEHLSGDAPNALTASRQAQALSNIDSVLKVLIS